ncbi:hypothetical protein [Bacillus sp. GMa5/1]|uniref:hypothetical protein n=1 Tax=Bacillus sp. GMa5/1 TaxID=3418496 RepID=UPI003CF1032C
MIDWFVKNAEWIFSGIGVLAISAIVGMFLNKRKNAHQLQKISAGNKSTNIQGSKNVNITFGEKNE